MKKLTLIIALALCAFIQQQPKITIWMIGDSTMANKQAKAFPETGWGMALGKFFQPNVTIDNRAQNGRSTLSFINEKRWEDVYNHLQEGDYVFIEFGHNDEKIDKPGVGTSLEEYRNNLARFIQEARSKKAFPVLLTPTMRRSYKNGVFIDSHGKYPDVVRTLADSLHVPLIDMHRKTEQLITSMGEEGSKKLFNYVEAGHPNYPQGKKDDTHFSPYGANAIASLAIEGIKELHLPLEKYLLNNK
ncbi:MAG: rhamnogalacturonan acetylesterase [Bacteroidota bacterium]|nr:rhamnogalacturonan acetylesterase [Bacteroidota bacterium]